MSREYFAMMALILVFATGYIIAVERSTYHDNTNKNSRPVLRKRAANFYN